MSLLSHDADSLPVSEITRLYLAKEYDEEDLRQVQKAMESSALPYSWKQYLYERANRRKV